MKSNTETLKEETTMKKVLELFQKLSGIVIQYSEI